MTQTAQREARELAILLGQQRDVYRRLRELACSQSSAIKDDRGEALLGVLADRQRLITQLGEINRQLEPFRSRWDHLRESMEPAQRLEVAELVEEVERLLGEILQHDEADSSELKQRSEQARGQASTVTAGRTAHSAYAAQRYAASAGKYIDQSDVAKD